VVGGCGGGGVGMGGRWCGGGGGGGMWDSWAPSIHHAEAKARGSDRCPALTPAAAKRVPGQLQWSARSRTLNSMGEERKEEKRKEEGVRRDVVCDRYTGPACMPSGRQTHLRYLDYSLAAMRGPRASFQDAYGIHPCGAGLADRSQQRRVKVLQLFGGPRAARKTHHCEPSGVPGA